MPSQTFGIGCLRIGIKSSTYASLAITGGMGLRRSRWAWGRKLVLKTRSSDALPF